MAERPRGPRREAPPNGDFAAYYTHRRVIGIFPCLRKVNDTYIPTSLCEFEESQDSGIWKHSVAIWRQIARDVLISALFYHHFLSRNVVFAKKITCRCE